MMASFSGLGRQRAFFSTQNKVKQSRQREVVTGIRYHWTGRETAQRHGALFV